MLPCYDASKSKVDKLSGNKQLSSVVKLVLSWTYTSSLNPKEYASVFFISTIWRLHLFVPSFKRKLKGSSIRHFQDRSQRLTWIGPHITSGVLFGPWMWIYWFILCIDHLRPCPSYVVHWKCWDVSSSGQMAGCPRTNNANNMCIIDFWPLQHFVRSYNCDRIQFITASHL